MEWPAMIKAKYEPIMRAKYCDIGWLGHGWRPIVEGLLDELLKYVFIRKQHVESWREYLRVLRSDPSRRP
mgnify:CR=1 FL=1